MNGLISRSPLSEREKLRPALSYEDEGFDPRDARVRRCGPCCAADRGRTEALVAAAREGLAGRGLIHPLRRALGGQPRAVLADRPDRV